MSLVVVKVGGGSVAAAARVVKALVLDQHKRSFAGGEPPSTELVLDQYKVCLVHGAGPQITAEMERRGLPVEFVGGRRVTTPEALAVVAASLAAVNTGLCAALGPRAAPFPDGVLAAQRVPGLGLVGDPLPSAPHEVVAALDAGLVPVVAPLAQGPLNVNGDEAAAALAVGLGAERLLFVTDVPGVLVEGEVAAALAADEAERLIDTGAFAGGIVPKLLAAAAAARLGVTTEIGATAVTA